ncbi:hypothetical protein HNO88_004213 [Novosphingobium chloroacetimidivorans]|uniref:Uncharacterized protein n=1 Tax=Novosphingobium chloroacetimidivorans TaxID=1428314 RepID=A0A7W7KDL0_9SPHN|nr:hypothetical protein [Novosphingobium chloroacetimidivorans]
MASLGAGSLGYGSAVRLQNEEDGAGLAGIKALLSDDLVDKPTCDYAPSYSATKNMPLR